MKEKKLIKKNKIGLMNDSDHLTDEGVALSVEVMIGVKKENKLPENIKTHLTECATCNDRVIDLYRDVKDESEVILRLNSQSDSIRKTIPFSHYLYKYSAAAILLVLVAVASFFLSQPPSTGDLFQKHFEPYPNILAMKSDLKNDLSKALLYYELKDWDSAILLFQNVLINDQTNSSAMFYLGNTYLAKGNSDQAIYWLGKASANDSKFNDQVNWYLALAYLAEGDRSNARNYLNNLTDSKSFYQKRAKKLLKQIR